MAVRDHRKLEVFQLADELVICVYQSTAEFPRSELFGLTSQMRRCAVSVAANIVEGCGRNTNRQFGHFLDIAFGSLRELGYFITLARRLNYVEAPEATELADLHGRTAAALAAFIGSRTEF